MKKIIILLSSYKKLLLIAFIMMEFVGFSQTTAIPDSNFEQALIDLKLDSDGIVNGVISQEDALNITRLDINDPENNIRLSTVDAKITDLTGIEAMINLAILNFDDNNVAGDLDLSNNIALTEVRASNNMLTSLDLSSSTALTSLQAANNNLTFLNIKNGFNSLLTDLYILGNTSICVQVDSMDYRHNSWVFTDDETTFSEDCLTPTITSNGGGETANIAIEENQVKVTRVISTGGTGTIHYSLGGADGSQFSITPEGLLTFNIAPDYEASPTKRNYTLTVTVTDSTTPTNLTDTQTINITITDIEEVSIPDENFEKALIDLKLDSDGIVNGVISQEDARGITELNLRYEEGLIVFTSVTAKITDLTGIEAMTNITRLDVNWNNLVEMLDLSKNTALTNLQVRSNELTFLNIQNGYNTSLSYFDAIENNSICIQVDDEDYRPVKGKGTWLFEEDAIFNEDCSDVDRDGVKYLSDTCPNTPTGEAVNENGCSESQIDTDNDGIFNNIDTCPDTPTGEDANESGCSESQIDTDNDGIFNNIDTCPDTPTGEDANESGCSESQIDTDNDGIFNNIDTCPDTPTGEDANESGCSESQIDTDNDGIFNNVDQCPDTPTGEDANESGCSESQIDTDNDGIFNNVDQCPNTPTGEAVNENGCSESQVDTDNDGIFNNIDTCPDTPTGEDANESGCSESQIDTDNDGIFNNVDQCPNTPTGEDVNGNGCSESQVDTDNDGIFNNIDTCPDTPTGEDVNENGCSESQIDTDNDGIFNNVDQCTNTPTGEDVNENGCSESQIDTDNDGVFDNIDTCPKTPTGEDVNGNGCSESQVDTDNDGVFDNIDQCNNTPSGGDVNAIGCTQLSSNNFEISSTTPSCPNINNGKISIKNISSHMFNFVVTGPNSYNKTFENKLANQPFVIENLAVGMYNITAKFSTDGIGNDIPGFQVAVNGATPVSGTNKSVNKLGKSSVFTVSGDKKYSIYVNDVFQRDETFSDESEYDIVIENLSTGKNHIKIIPENICRGLIENWIIIPNGDIKFYPNPTGDLFHIAGLESSDINVRVFAPDGQQVYNKNHKPVNGVVYFSTRDLSAGFYIVRVSGDKSGDIINFKMTKK